MSAALCVALLGASPSQGAATICLAGLSALLPGCCCLLAATLTNGARTRSGHGESFFAQVSATSADGAMYYTTIQFKNDPADPQKGDFAQTGKKSLKLNQHLTP